MTIFIYIYLFINKFIQEDSELNVVSQCTIDYYDVFIR